jgi:hypothetical protein
MMNLLIRIFYWLKLRTLVNKIQRRFAGENSMFKISLPTFNTPKEIETYINSRFKYRLDTGSILGFSFPLDWVTEPEVFQYKLLSNKLDDGDCDDYHYWVATCLSKIVGVTEIYMLMVGYVKGGHAVCVYEYQGEWYLFDYEIIKIKSPDDAPHLVSVRHTKENNEVLIKWYIFENLDFSLKAAIPETI